MRDASLRVGLLRHSWLLLVLCLPGIAEAASVSATPATYLAVLPTLAPGDTLTLSAGTYTGNLPLSGRNGSAGAWITIQGPATGTALFLATATSNTVELVNCSFVAIKNLELNGQHLSGPFGVSAKGSSNLTHDILIEGLTIRDYDGSQQTVGISTKCPTWNWTIRGNRILSPGTGLYLGNSDGTCPFVKGVIENNLVQSPIGYCMEIKWQLPRPAIAGMPTGASRTQIRNNVFIKNDRISPDGDRPNLLVGGFPDSGAGASDMYEIYGNVLCHNPRESLLQVSGRVTIHDNLLLDVPAGNAILCQNHNLALKVANVYNNTILRAATGIRFGNAAQTSDAVIGNLIFATTSTAGTIVNLQGNLADSFANAGNYLTNPSTTLGTFNAYPKSGTCTGAALNLSALSGDTAWNLDFNGTSKGGFTYRGAYAGSGTNPGWQPVADLKPPASPLPTLVVSTASLSVAEGGTATFQVRLSAVPAATTTVTVSRTAGDSDLTVSGGASLSFTTANWNTLQTVTLAAAEDADTSNGTATITVASAGLTSQAVAASEVDNDNALVVSVASVNVAEGGTATFQVRLSAAPTATTTVTVSRTAGDTDLTVSGGASLSFTTANWNTLQTVTLAAAEDADSSNGTATIIVASAGLTSQTVAASEVDNDNGLVVSVASLNVAEGGSATFQVRLSAAPAATRTVTVTRTAGDADLTVSGGSSLSFTTTNWNTLQTVTLAAAEDADTSNGTATITIASAGLTSQAVAASEMDNDGGTASSGSGGGGDGGGGCGMGAIGVLLASFLLRLRLRR